MAQIMGRAQVEKPLEVCRVRECSRGGHKNVHVKGLAKVFGTWGTVLESWAICNGKYGGLGEVEGKIGFKN